MIHNTKEHFNKTSENFCGKPSGFKFESDFLLIRGFSLSGVISTEWRVWTHLLFAIDKKYGEIHPELKAHNVLSEITNGAVDILGTSIMDEPYESRPDSVWDIIMAEKKKCLHWFSDENPSWFNILEKKSNLDKAEIERRFISSTQTLGYLLQSLPFSGEISDDTQCAMDAAYEKLFHKNMQ